MKVKLPVDIQKIINYIMLHGKVKNFHCIERDNSRLYKAGNKLINEGVLVRKDGYININTKNPLLKYLKDTFDGNNDQVKIDAYQKEKLKEMNNKRDLKFSSATLTDTHKLIKKSLSIDDEDLDNS
jgi:hypothetical protein